MSLLFALFAALSAFAQAHEAVLMGGWETCTPEFESWYHGEALEWVGTSRTEKDSQLRGMAVDGSGQVYVLSGRDPYQIQQVWPDGTRAPFATGAGWSTNLAATRDGRVYVLANDAGTRRIDRFSRTGALEASYPLPSSKPDGVGLDVAPDGCTLVWGWASNNRDRISGYVERFNGCTGQELPRFDVAYPKDLVALADGGVLVGTQRNVLQYDANGAFVREVAPRIDTYNLPEWHSYELKQIALRGPVLWMVVGNCLEAQLLRVSLDDGRELSRRPVLLVNAPWQLALAPAAAIPTLSSVAIALLALGLAAVGALRL
ncbi:MAG TPA: hypothetical protein VM733_07065 [Thermoanaerobaculia bacterium]|nr:hypothetical protein [Thermoanaerobaculia bacterium]